MSRDEAPTRPDIPKVRPKREDPLTWKPRKAQLARNWTEEVAADLSRDARVEPE